MLQRLRSDRPALLACAALALVLATFAALSLEGADASVGARLEGRLAVADLRGHALVVVDRATLEVDRRIALPGGPHELVRLPDGRIGASLEQRGALALISVDTGSVEIVEVGGAPHGLDVSRGILYVTDRSAGSIRRFELEEWREFEPADGGTTPHSVAVMPDGGLVVASAGADALSLNSEPLARLALPETVAVSTDGTLLATAGALDGRVVVLDATGAAAVDVYAGRRPVRVAFSPDGSLAAAALSADAAVALVEVETGDVRRIHTGGVPDGLAFSSDGRYLHVSDLHEGRVLTLDLEAGLVVAEADVGESAGALMPLD